MPNAKTTAAANATLLSLREEWAAANRRWDAALEALPQDVVKIPVKFEDEVRRASRNRGRVAQKIYRSVDTSLGMTVLQILAYLWEHDMYDETPIIAGEPITDDQVVTMLIRRLLAIEAEESPTDPIPAPADVLAA